MNELSTLFGSPWASMALNGVLIASLIVGATWALLKITSAFKPINAATSYTVWSFSLVLIFLVHSALWVVGTNNSSDASESAILSQTAVVAASGPSSSTMRAPESAPESASASVSENATFSESTVPTHVDPAGETMGAGFGIHRLPATGFTEPDITPSVSSSNMQPTTGAVIDQLPVVESGTTIQLSRIPSIALILLFALATGFGLFRLVRLGVHVLRLKRYRNSGNDITLQCLDEKTHASFRRSIRIVESSQVASPAAAGLFGATILLPVGLRDHMSHDALRQIVLHEAAHLERYDDWSILVQRMVESVFFFNPLVWVVGAEMDTFREMACDDWVVSRTGQPEAYVSSISNLLAVYLTSTPNTLTAGLSAGRRSLLDRMKRVLEGSTEPSTTVSKQQVAMLAGLCSLALVVVFAISPFVQFLFSFGVDHAIESSEVVPVVDAMPVAPVMPMAPVVPVSPVDAVFQSQTVLDTVVEAPALAPLLPLEAELKSTRPALAVNAPLAQGTVDGISDPLSLKSWIRLLEATTIISSDSERASLLRYALDRMPNSEPAVTAYLEAVLSLSSSSERTRLLQRMIEQLDLDEASQVRVIRAVSTISSDSEKARAIESAIRHMDRSSINESELERAIARISSESQRTRLLRTLNNQF